MGRIFGFIAGAVALLCLGCSKNAPVSSQSDDAKMHRLETTLDKIQGNPNSSIELKTMATGVSQKLANDRAVEDFSR
jgi:hypothetical protein